MMGMRNEESGISSDAIWVCGADWLKLFMLTNEIAKYYIHAPVLSRGYMCPK